jgi:hypothetical protein
MDARSRRTLFVVVLTLFFALSVVRLVVTLRRDGIEGATVWIALLVVGLVVVVTLGAVLRRAGAVAAHAARQRPGARVIPAFTTAQTVDEARAVGASTRGWMPVGGSPLALVVLDDRVEVWARQEDRPRWAVRRLPGAAGEARAIYGSRETRALQVSDGLAAVTVVPAYRPLRATGGTAGADIARAVAEIAGR